MVSQGLERHKNRLQEWPFWMETPPTALGSAAEGSGEGRVSWSVANTAVYGGYAFPRVCFNRARDSQFHGSLSLSTHRELFIYSGKKKTYPKTTNSSPTSVVSNQAPLPEEQLSIQSSTRAFQAAKVRFDRFST